MQSIPQLCGAAREAAGVLAQAGTRQKNQALAQIAEQLVAQTPQILAANSQDLAAAAQNGMSPAMQDRLRLTAERIAAIAAAVREIIALPDPVGQVLQGTTRPNGLKITKTRVPLGVVGIIYEARPNVTADAAALCLKSGNACLLRGGKEALASKQAIVQAIGAGLAQAGLPAACVGLVEDTSREVAKQMMTAHGLLDVLIPRGGAGLIQSVVQNATVPVIETGVGNCHIFADESCTIAMAVDIIENAKVSRPSVCNAAETLLVHHGIAPALLPALHERLGSRVELRCCPATREILGSNLPAATEEDYATEFNDYILAVRVVDDLQQALEHIARYSTGHSEAILTESYANAQRFTAEVDAAAVYVNASTRFTDGGEFGLGAEIGISTQKLHARGPMGLEELTTVKYIVFGSGQIRE